MPPIQIFPGDEHVTVVTAGVGMVALLQDHYCIPHMAAYEVNLEVVPTSCPPPYIPWPGTPLSSPYTGRRPCTLSPSVDPTTNQDLSPACAGYADGSPENPTPDPSRSLVTGIYYYLSPGGSAPLPSSVLSTPPPTGSPQTVTVVI